MKNIFLGVLTALILFCGCKSRKVSLNKIDSSAKSQESTKVISQVSQKDNSIKTEIKSIVKTDSSETTIEIQPAEGKIITVNKDGSFSGEAKSVKLS